MKLTALLAGASMALLSLPAAAETLYLTAGKFVDPVTAETVNRPAFVIEDGVITARGTANRLRKPAQAASYSAALLCSTRHMPRASALARLPMGLERSHRGSGRVWYVNGVEEAWQTRASASIALDCPPPCDTNNCDFVGRDSMRDASFRALFPQTSGQRTDECS